VNEHDGGSEEECGWDFGGAVGIAHEIPDVREEHRGGGRVSRCHGLEGLGWRRVVEEEGKRVFAPVLVLMLERCRLRQMGKYIPERLPLGCSPRGPRINGSSIS
jgi:hypothetical protein